MIVTSHAIVTAIHHGTIIPHGFESDLVFEHTNSRDFLWAYALITLGISNYSSYLHPCKVCLKTNHRHQQKGLNLV